MDTNNMTMTIVEIFQKELSIYKKAMCAYVCLTIS